VRHRLLTSGLVGAAALAFVAGCGGPSTDPGPSTAAAPSGDARSAAAPSGDREPSDDGVAVPPVRLSPTEPGPQGRVPQFVVECGFSHAAADDPIVAPGHAGHSHVHVFFGNTSTSADSTAEDLAQGGTTCDQHLDLASYWAPALYDHGELVTPRGAVAYYRPGVGVDPATVEPYPYGLKVVGGDPHAAGPQSLDVVAWSCGTGSARAASPPTCPEGRPLRMAVSFPDCWDGERVDSPDHTAHMARSAGSDCPASHPVPVPQLLLTISYPVTGGGHDLSLASGPLATAHADFFNAWDEAKLRTEVETCIRRGLTCGVASNRT
jgi:hypothetical protein